MPYVAITLLVVCCTNFRWSLSQWLLKNLITCRVPTKEQIADQKKREHVQAIEQNPSLRKKSFKKTDGPEEQLMLIPTAPEGLLQRVFFSEFDRLVFFVSVVAANLMLVQVLYLVQPEKRAQNGGVVLTCFAVVAAATAVSSLYRTQSNRLLTPAFERTLGQLAGGGSALCSLVVLFAIPSEFLDFELEQATAAFNKSLKSMHAQVPEIPVALLMGTLPIVAGILGGVAVAPAVRAVRCYMLATSPPDWAEGQLTKSFMTKASFHLNMVVPLAVVVLWVRPLVEQPLELSAELMVYLRAGATMLAGGLMLAMLRPQVQSFLDNGMVVWYENLHGTTTTSNQEKEKQAQYVRMHLELNNTMLCKAALQMFAPGVILVSFAALIWQKGVMTNELPADTAFLPAILFKSVFSFLAWWLCCMWTLASYTTLGMFRYGRLM
eukprot:CAMPEP_0198230466 /NCGR_PEP_ID=MMETSP1445-20131203/114678_1 /TAXON_ID=36898 /ORGANISM="Pyramimonas sp., Strain CCMP2087" /LENGTH=435 /DNA_ID=CAMNT_0043911009 /DNA_START=177 /DNA_END=1484 /DNA_ORIENTATION=-